MVCEQIRSVMSNAAIEISMNPQWHESFCRGEINRALRDCKELCKHCDPIEELIKELAINRSGEYLIELGFLKMNDVFLLPLWILPFVEDGRTLFTKNGDTFTYSQSMKRTYFGTQNVNFGIMNFPPLTAFRSLSIPTKGKQQ